MSIELNISCNDCGDTMYEGDKVYCEGCFEEKGEEASKLEEEIEKLKDANLMSTDNANDVEKNIKVISDALSELVTLFNELKKDKMEA